MKKLNLTWLLALLPLITLAQSLSFEKTGEGAWIKEDGEKVLFYQAQTKALDGEYARANYVHPLFNVDGYELTEDFPKDHLHHRGIFWTWHQVLIGDQSIGDAWECKDFIWDVVEYGQAADSKTSISLKAKILWKSPQWRQDDGDMKAFVEENTEIEVYGKKDNYRIIDFTISLLALEPDLRIGGSDDNKGYGGFSVRVKMPKDISFSYEDVSVEPKTEQVESGPWLKIAGIMASENGQGGVIIMNHPDNPIYPEKWILRKSGSMQNPVYPGRTPVPVSMESPTVLKYRLVVYAGEMTNSEIEKVFESYQ